MADETETGVDPETDGKTTIERLRFAAEDGHAESMYLLGVALAQGQGVARDDVEAARLFHRAAKKGHAAAKTSLGFFYADGRGVRADRVRAYVLLKEAALAGDRLAQDLSRRLRLHMSPQQIQEAERRLPGAKR